MAVKTRNRMANLDGEHVAEAAPRSKAAAPTRQEVKITAPNLQTAVFNIVGETPYMQHRFSQKALLKMRAKQEAGSQATKGTKRQPRDFDSDYEESRYVSSEGWLGMPAPAFRSAMISACRLVGFKMTMAKLSIFILADGFDRADAKPLVKIIGKPERTEMPMRNDNGGVDIRVRPMWREWSCALRVQFDPDQFSLPDVTNLLLRAGQQVGVGEGRNDSRNCAGIGFGKFGIGNK